MVDMRRRFELEVLPHLDAAYRFARWLARSSDDVDDIVQEAIVRAYRAFDGLRGSDVKVWLLTIVRNCHSTERKQRLRRVLVPLPEEYDARDHRAAASSKHLLEGEDLSPMAKRTLREQPQFRQRVEHQPGWTCHSSRDSERVT